MTDDDISFSGPSTSSDAKDVAPRNYVTIVLGNVIPAAGVIYWGWSILLLFGYYLVELLLAGTVNLVKIHLAGKHRSPDDSISEPRKFLIDSAKKYAVTWLTYLSCLGIVIGFAYVEKVKSDEPTVAGFDTKLADHPMFAFDADLQMVAIVFGLGLLIWIGEQIMEFAVKKPYLHRTMKEQNEAMLAKLYDPLLAGFIAALVFIGTHNPTLTVLTLATVKLGLDILQARGLVRRSA